MLSKKNIFDLCIQYFPEVTELSFKKCDISVQGINYTTDSRELSHLTLIRFDYESIVHLLTPPDKDKDGKEIKETKEEKEKKVRKNFISMFEQVMHVCSNFRASDILIDGQSIIQTAMFEDVVKKVTSLCNYTPPENSK